MSTATHATMWTYAWDLLDEGVDAVLGRLQQEVGLDAISVATSYHTVAHLRPHSPAGRWFIAHDAAVYFRPAPELWQGLRLQPNVSALARARNPLAEICAAAERRGLRVISWTVCLHNTYLGRTHPDCAVHNAYADVLTSDLCPANPDVRAYVTTLARDLSSNYPLAALELEAIGYSGWAHFHGHEKIGFDLGPAGRFLLELCFCPHCRERGQAHGVDVARLQQDVRAMLDDAFARGAPVTAPVESVIERTPGLRTYLEAREETVTTLVREVRAASHCPIRTIYLGAWHSTGGNTRALAQESESIDVLAYTSVAEQVRRTARSVLEEMGPEASPDRLLVGLQAYPPHATSAEVLVANVRAALELGVRRFSFYNYGIMPLPCLGWVAQAVRVIRAAEP
jgi:hypothetical protein